MSYQYSFAEKITISGDALKRFGWKHNTQHVRNLAQLIADVGISAEVLTEEIGTFKKVPAYIIIWDFGKVPEFGENGGTAEIKRRFEKLAEITGGNLDNSHYQVTDENHNSVDLSTSN